jgi:hypothetical protein
MQISGRMARNRGAEVLRAALSHEPFDPLHDVLFFASSSRVGL